MAKFSTSETSKFSLTPLASALAIALGIAGIAADASAAQTPRQHMQAIEQAMVAARAQPAGKYNLFHARNSHALKAPTAISATLAVTTCVDNASSATTPGTLRYEVINAAEGAALDLTGLSCSLITLSQGALPVTVDNLTVNGPTGGGLTIDGASNDRVFYHSGYGQLALNNLIVTGGVAAYDSALPTGKKRKTINGAAASLSGALGGCIDSAGAVYLNNTTVTDCSATYSDTATTSGGALGGAVFAYALNMVSSTISNSSASATFGYAAGGGAFVPNPNQAAITHARRSIKAPRAKAGAYYGVAYLDHSTISGNQAVGGGAAVGGGVLAYSVYSNVSKISGNTAQQTIAGNGNTKYVAFGGGIASKYHTRLNFSTVSGNSVTCAAAQNGCLGGGMITLSTNFNKYTSVYYSTIDHNHADFAGGGVLAEYGLTIANSTVSGNTAVSGGGIALITPTSSNALPRPLRPSNTAAIGPGKYLYNSTIAANSASVYGGGVYAYGNTYAGITSTIIAKNSAPSGADMYSEYGFTPNGSNNLVIASSGVTLPADTLNSDPNLQPLADNGGPTKTHALTNGSPALDVGLNPLDLTDDQRGDGFPRLLGAGTDIGAFEGSLAALAPPVAAPMLSAWALGLLATLFGWLGWRRRRADAH